WPLPSENVTIIKELVMEQLKLGHIKPSHSPWNTPIFTIQKKSGKWRLLHDLRAINDVMQSIGALQSGLPSLLMPTMLPQNWPLLVIDLKDCFFSIPLQPNDWEKFAFLIPTVNRAAPSKRYHWMVLPQGMKNSPTICQWYVDQALKPYRQAHPHHIVYHYMDDIVICAKNLNSDQTIQELLPQLESWGLKIAPQKIKKISPRKYLGLQVIDSQIRPLPTTIPATFSTLHEVQTLVGSIQWTQPIAGLSNNDLDPLYQLL
ncbi:Putative Pol polyprotein, partial [Buceros rhinoceros silvestris]